MPQSTVLPSVSPSFARAWVFPSSFMNLDIGNSIGTALTDLSGSDVGSDYQVGAISQAFGGDNVGPQWALHGGRLCCSISNTLSDWAAGYTFGEWAPGFDPSAFNGGALYDPSSVVGIFDFHAAFSTGLQEGPDDTTGYWFVPRISFGPNLADLTLGGSSVQGGFGITPRDDGAGNAEWTFVSYDGTPTTLLRVVLSDVADPTDWNSFRFIIVAANSGSNATLSLEVNGSPVAGVTDLEFDDATLMRPNTLQANSAGFQHGATLNAWNGETMRFQFFNRYGRFTPSGTEVQGI